MLSNFDEGRRAGEQRSVGGLDMKPLQRISAINPGAQLTCVAARGVYPVDEASPTQLPVGRDFAAANRTHAVEVNRAGRKALRVVATANVV